MHSYINKNEPNGSLSRNTLPVALEGCGQVGVGDMIVAYYLQYVNNE